jgi:formamidopyrimidine-DNA glycosylase
MPELPDLSVYLECIEQRALGQMLTGMRIGHPFLLRSVTPAPSSFIGLKLQKTGRIGKRLLLQFEGGRRIVIHLMILGRLHWKKPKAARLCICSTLMYQRPTSIAAAPKSSRSLPANFANVCCARITR